MNSITPPTFEWLQLAPVLTVLLAACLGVLVEAVVPRRWRFISQIALFEVAVLVAFVFLVLSWRLPANSLGLMAMGSISLDGPTYLMWGALLVFGLLSLLIFSERDLDNGSSAFAASAASCRAASRRRRRTPPATSTARSSRWPCSPCRE